MMSNIVSRASSFKRLTREYKQVRNEFSKGKSQYALFFSIKVSFVVVLTPISLRCWHGVSLFFYRIKSVRVVV